MTTIFYYEVGLKVSGTFYPSKTCYNRLDLHEAILSVWNNCLKGLRSKIRVRKISFEKTIFDEGNYQITYIGRTIKTVETAYMADVELYKQRQFCKSEYLKTCVKAEILCQDN